MNIKLAKRASTIAAGVLTTLLVGCAATSSSTPSKSISQQAKALEATSYRKITVHTDKTIKKNWGPNRLFALIESKGDHWELVSVSTRYPARREQQEIFLITRDLSLWETTVANEKHCIENDSVGYSVCTSALATRQINSATIVGGTLAALMTGGVSLIASGKSMHYDKDALRQAVESIPEEQAQAVVAKYLAEEATKMQRESQELAKLHRACIKNHDEETQRLETAAAQAKAAVQTGKQLSLLERTSIARAEMRWSSFSACASLRR